MTDLTGLGGIFRCEGSASLTTITFPPSTRAFDDIFLNGCDLNYVDITVMPNCLDNNNCRYRFQGNSMTAAEVNQMLVDADTISDGLYTGRTIIADGTNASPDGTSGGFDGLTAKANLISKGFTVTTN